ncbi:MAG TPA: HAD family hydrolase [Waterburya sp.]|jgi:HAD superfamily hydrolase (TIGR01509 family)
MLNAVIFDVDGTLVDTVDLHTQAWQEAFQAYGYDLPYDQIRHQIGKGSDQLFPVFISQEEIERVGKPINQRRLEIYKKDMLPKVRPFPKVRELFERIKADGKKVLLASSSEQEILETYKQLLQIEDLIDNATSTDDAAQSKPEPDIFQAALEKLDGIKAEEVIVVGDTPYDAEAANKTNVPTIGVLCGGFPEAELREAGCIAVFRDPADLLAHYEQSPLAKS